MALAFQIVYGKLVKKLLVGNQGWLNRTNNLATVPEGTTNGAVSLTYISAVTAAAVADGTVITNNTDSVTVAGVYIDYQAAVSLKPSQAKSFYIDAENMEQVAQSHADAFYIMQQNALVADLVASTPLTSANKTLTLGQIDFVTDGTQAEADDNLRNMAVVVALMQANHNGQLDKLSIVMPPTAWANFVVLNSTTFKAPVNVLQPSELDGATYSFIGIPIFVVAGATNFGGADNHVAFVTSKDNILLARQEPHLHGGGLIKASDGTTKMITIGPFAHAVITGRFGEVINPSS